MSGAPNRPSDSAEAEPVTIRDKRRIDPETGEVRVAPGASQPRAGESGESSVSAGSAVSSSEAAIDVETVDVAQGDNECDDETVDVAQGADDNEGADPIVELTAALDELTADLQRVSAEYANYRRRVERDRQSVIDSAKASVVTELLGVLDDLDRARIHGDLDDGPMRSVADKLMAAMTTQGLGTFGAVGDEFDPSVHEAVQHDGEGHDPVVGAVLRRGYKLGDRVLRGAMVAVTDRAPESAESPQAPAAETADAGAEAAASDPAASETAGSDK